MNVERIIIVGGPMCGKSTLAATFGMPVFCGDPISTVREPQDGVTYLPEGLGWSESSEYVVEHWLTMPGPWVIEGHIMARALRKYEGDADPADQIIVMLEHHPAVCEVTKGQASMLKAVRTVWDGIADRYTPLVKS